MIPVHNNKNDSATWWQEDFFDKFVLAWEDLQAATLFFTFFLMILYITRNYANSTMWVPVIL